MRWLATTSALLVFAWSGAARAHVNVESRRAELRDDPFSALVDFQFGFSQGNVNTLNVALQDRLAFSSGRHLIFLFNQSGFASKTLARNRLGVSDLVAERYKNAHLGHLRYSFRILDWLAAEAFTQLQTNEFLLLRTRWLLGATPRFTAFENEQFGLYFGAAYIAEYEDLDQRFFADQPGGFGHVNWWHRLGLMAAMSLAVHDRADVLTTTYVQPRFDAPADLRIFNQAELDIEITEHFSFKLVATISHDTRPPRLCTSALAPGDACPPGEALGVLPTDVSLDNALSVHW